jgi:plastocyanin
MVRRGVGTVVFAGMLAVALTASACGSSEDSGTGGTPSAQGGGATAALTVKDFAFDPSTVAVSSGEATITVTNEGTVKHSFTLDDGSVSQDIEPGESASVSVSVSADAPFHCKYHTQMTGTLTVG